MNARNATLLPSLATIISPLDARTFLTDYWGHRHLVAHGRSDRLSELLGDLERAELPQLLAESSSVVVLFRGDDGQPRSINAGPAEALNLYHAGMTLYFPLSRAPLRSWAQRLAVELGVSPERIQMSIFACRTGGGLECHFDANENFTVQLKGQKRWRVSDSRSVEATTSNSGTDNRAASDLHVYRFEPLPLEMPAPASEVDLQPGSVLYVPQGSWHETEASGESLSLNICVQATSWLDHVLLPALRASLLQNAKWRRWPTGMFGTAEARNAARDELAQLLEGLPQDLRDLTADCFLDNQAPRRLKPAALVRRNPLISLHIDRYTGGGRGVVRIIYRRPLMTPRQVEVELSAHQLRACSWVATYKGTFAIKELCAAAPGISKADLNALLNVLQQERVILEP
jgi:50S ribosomal protein L16 3-hydroxylase